jgi:hypothetical protein
VSAKVIKNLGNGDTSVGRPALRESWIGGIGSEQGFDAAAFGETIQRVGQGAGEALGEATANPGTD